MSVFEWAWGIYRKGARDAKWTQRLTFFKRKSKILNQEAFTNSIANIDPAPSGRSNQTLPFMSSM
jgi:hypothetical protein